MQEYTGTITLSLILIILGLWYRYRRKLFSTFKDLGIPGPEPNIIFGNYWQLAKKSPLDCQKEWFKKYGKVVGYYFGAHPTILVADVDLAKQILIKDFNKFPNRPNNLRSNSKNVKKNEPFGSQLTTLRGNEWKEIRSIITPSFTANKMKLMVPAMNSAVDSLINILDKKFENGESFDIYRIFQGLTMDVIGRTAFGIQTNVQNNPDDIILKASKVIFSGHFKSVFMSLAVSFPELGTMWKIVSRVRMIFKNEGRNPIQDIVDHTKNILKLRRQENNSKRQDLLQIMMDAKIKESDLENISNEELTVDDTIKEGKNKENEEINGSIKHFRQMTDHEIADNSILFFLAGYETTSTALAFVTYFLLKYPDVQEKIRDEIKSTVEKGVELDYSSVQQMKYLDQVVMESLRLYPPIYLFVNREAVEDVTYGNYKIKKGMSVQIPVYYMNHDPESWDNPEEFKPERFAPENKSNVNLMAFQTFGTGPRNCVGMRFAQLEIKLAITKILQKYRLIRTKETEIESVKLRISPATLTPINGIKLKLEPV